MLWQIQLAFLLQQQKPRKIFSTCQEFGEEGSRGWGEGRKNKKPEVKKMDTNKFQILFKNQFGIRETIAKKLLAKVNDGGCETCVATTSGS